MNIRITNSKKIQQYRKTHNLYMYTKNGKTYYKAVPKTGYKRERKNMFWPALAILTLIVFPIALSLDAEPAAQAEEVEVIEEVVVEEEQPESKGEEVSETPLPSYSGVCAEYYDLVNQYDWDTNTALAVMYAESRCNPTAVNHNTNGTQDTGLFQLNSAYWKQTFDPEENVAEAYRIYTRWGYSFNAWVAYTSGAYARYL